MQMKNPERTRDIWYHLDNAAIIFPAVSGSDNTNVFRLSCTLRFPVEPGTLQQALDIALESFPYFQVVMRRGLFWFYLERTMLTPLVKQEAERPCARLFYKSIKELLFRVTYFQNRINLEVFHAVADGAGAFDFLRAIVYNYIVLAYRAQLPEQLMPLDREPDPSQQIEDSFQHYYDSTQKRGPFKRKAYTIGGTMLPSGGVRVITAQLSTAAMLALAKTKGATITAYLAALMICAIYHENMPGRAAGRNIGVTVPVDLRGHFTSETSRNFFCVVDVEYNFAQQGGDFDQVLESVSLQLRDKISRTMLSQRMNYNMSVQKNILTRFTPLVLKNAILRAAYHKAETTTSCALSNLGRITMPKPFDEFVDYFFCMLNPTRLHRWKACVNSYGDKFIINFTSCIAETRLHKYFVRHLTAAGLEVSITCNGGAVNEVL